MSYDFPKNKYHVPITPFYYSQKYCRLGTEELAAIEMVQIYPVSLRLGEAECNKICVHSTTGHACTIMPFKKALFSDLNCRKLKKPTKQRSGSLM